MSFLLLVLAAACGDAHTAPDGGGPPPDAGVDAAAPDTGTEPDAGPGVDYYDPAHVLSVDITMAPADWDELRSQSRDFLSLLVGSDCLDDPFDDPFSWFEASVTIDGITLDRIAVTKKGFLGSLSDEKPSLRLDFDMFVPDQSLSGTERLTLNNAQQDPSYLNQCLGYRVFAAAGVPAPRCNFARVSVNGMDLGLYVNVEPVRKPFLREHFGDDTGKLWEGTISDFRTGFTGTFEQKIDEEVAYDRADLDAVMAAAAAPDATLLTELDRVIDLDGFFTFWAVEVLLGHWDGYAGNTNNYFVYTLPMDGRMRFVPWGADQIFLDQSPAAAEGGAQQVMTTGVIADRLWRHPEGRARYVAAMREVLSTAWDAGDLFNEIARMERLIRPELTPRDMARGFEEQLRRLRDFTGDREEMMLAAIDLPFDPPPLRETFCFVELGTARGTFEATFDNGDPFGDGATGTFDLTIEGTPVTFTAIGALAGPADEDPALANVGIVGVLPDGTARVAFVQTAAFLITGGSTIDVDWRSAFGYLIDFPPGGAEPVISGVLAGTLTIEAGSAVAGERVRGSLDMTVYASFF